MYHVDDWLLLHSTDSSVNNISCSEISSYNIQCVILFLGSKMVQDLFKMRLIDFFIFSNNIKKSIGNQSIGQ